MKNMKSPLNSSGNSIDLERLLEHETDFECVYWLVETRNWALDDKPDPRHPQVDETVRAGIEAARTRFVA